MNAPAASPTHFDLSRLAAHHETAGEQARRDGNEHLAALHLAASSTLDDAINALLDLEMADAPFIGACEAEMHVAGGCGR